MIRLDGEHERVLWHDALIAALTRSESGAAEVADEAVRAYRERTVSVPTPAPATQCGARKTDQGLVTVCELHAGHANEHVGGDQMARRAWRDEPKKGARK